VTAGKTVFLFFFFFQTATFVSFAGCSDLFFKTLDWRKFIYKTFPSNPSVLQDSHHRVLLCKTAANFCWQSELWKFFETHLGSLLLKSLDFLLDSIFFCLVSFAGFAKLLLQT
jgi:hypothetical protein